MISNFFHNNPQDVTRLILVRHGRTKKNVQARIGIIDDTSIDEIGCEQARLVAERLMSFSVSSIFTSPVKRAVQTAQIISQKISLEFQVHQSLIEMNLGHISGKTFEEVKKGLPEDFKKIIYWTKSQSSSNIERPVYSGMEPIEELERRIQVFIDFILGEYPGKTVCAVTHLAVIKGIMATLFGRTVKNPMNFIAFNTAISIIDFENNVPILMRFNDCSHLDMDQIYGKVTAL